MGLRNHRKNEKQRLRDWPIRKNRIKQRKLLSNQLQKKLFKKAANDRKALQRLLRIH